VELRGISSKELISMVLGASTLNEVEGKLLHKTLCGLRMLKI
jgi:hypothetical protein